MEINTLWALKSKGHGRSFAGNAGYEDETGKHYIYDTTVQYHKRIKQGDHILLIDKRHIKGYGVIDKIEIKDSIKERYLCPECKISEITFRKTIHPAYVCKKGHMFDEPYIQRKDVTEFKAIYSSGFLIPEALTSVSFLEKHYVKRNTNYSIQELKPEALQDIFPNKLLDLRTLGIRTIPPYVPSGIDQRIYKELRAAIRTKQDQFRNDLFDHYGPVCMLTGCTVPIAIEASHVCPFRGEADNHIENGLLLRRDLHKLFDEGLIGLEPDTLKVHLSSELLDTEYKAFEGKCLIISNKSIRPSREALLIRWLVFQQDQLV